MSKEFQVRLSFALNRALSVDLAYELRHQLAQTSNTSPNTPPGATPAAVLMLFGASSSARASTSPTPLGDTQLLFTRRADSVETHKGQVAFPGGVCESADRGDAAATALREANEEVGIPLEFVKVVGRMPELLTVTRFLVTPVVAILERPIDDTQLTPNMREIAEIFWVPLRELMAPDAYRREAVVFKGVKYPIDVFLVRGQRIWGATGSMVKNMLDRLASLG